MITVDPKYECEKVLEIYLKFMWHLLYDEEVCPICNLKLTAKVENYMRDKHIHTRCLRNPKLLDRHNSANIVIYNTKEVL